MVVFDCLCFVGVDFLIVFLVVLVFDFEVVLVVFPSIHVCFDIFCLQLSEYFCFVVRGFWYSWNLAVVV